MHLGLARKSSMSETQYNNSNSREYVLEHELILAPSCIEKIQNFAKLS